MRTLQLRLCAVAAAASVASGCAFTQMTDRSFFGSPDAPPMHADRQWVGAFVLPLAAAGDIVTGPFQFIVLLIGGDDALYMKDPRGFTMLQSDGSDLRLATAGLLDEGTVAKATPGVWGIDAAGRLVPVEIDEAGRVALMARAAGSAPTVR